jgi:hypothetical protein
LQIKMHNLINMEELSNTRISSVLFGTKKRNSCLIICDLSDEFD